MTTPKSSRESTPRSFPRSHSDHNPNLATLGRLRALRKPRLLQPEARRHQVLQECRAC